MKTLPVYVSVCAVTIIMAGCTSDEAHWDELAMRQRALDYYSDEIMDNLIRGSNGMVMLHVDIAGLTALVTTRLSATVGGGQTLMDTNERVTQVPVISAGNIVRGAVQVMSTATQMAMRPFSFSLNPERDNALTVDAQPVVDDPTVYTPYIKFLQLKSPEDWKPNDWGNSGTSNKIAKTDTFGKGKITFEGIPLGNIFSVQSVDASTPPPAYVPGTLKKWGHKVYFVPWCYRQAYSDLCLILTQRPFSQKPQGTPSSTAKRTLQKAIELQLQTM